MIESKNTHQSQISAKQDSNSADAASSQGSAHSSNVRLDDGDQDQTNARVSAKNSHVESQTEFNGGRNAQREASQNDSERTKGKKSEDAKESKPRKPKRSENTKKHSKETFDLYIATKELIDQVTTALNDGQLSEGIELHKRCQNQLHQLSGLEFERKKVVQLQKKLNVCFFQIRELRDWRHWGVDQNRINLIKSLQKLKNYEGSPQELYARINAIQKLWKHWNQAGDYPSRSLRDQFSKAYEEAFKPCREHFKAQKNIRRENKKIRISICRELEELFDSVDWTQPDWAMISTALRESRKHWKKAVPLNNKDWNSTNSLFDAVLAKFEPHIKQEREKGIRFRKQLIENAKQLDSLPIKVAINKAKEYQNDWKQVVIRGHKKKEKELWNQFRTACDRQFERRSELRKTADRKNQEIVETKKALIDKIKSLNELPDDEVTKSRKKARNIQHQWKEARVSDARAKKYLEVKFNHEISKFQKHVRLAEKKSIQINLSVLATKAAVCETLELMGIGGECEKDLQEIQQKWERIAGDCGEFEKAIGERFTSALNLARNYQSEKSEELSEQLARNLELKQHICLQLEVFSELDSPPEFSRERMLLNVQRLNAAMTKQEKNFSSEEKTHKLLIHYWLTGAVPSEAHAPLQQRFNRIYEAFQARTA